MSRVVWLLVVCALLLAALPAAAAPAPVPAPTLSPREAYLSAPIVQEGEFTRWKEDEEAASFHLAAASSNVSADWMGVHMRTLGPLTLRQLLLPGTHDSGAYELSKHLAPGISGSDEMNAIIEAAQAMGIPVDLVIIPWALAQRANLLRQAEAGARYFDLRVCWNGTHLLTHHFATGNTIQTLMNDLATFMRAHPSELIVIEAQLWNPKGKGTVPLHAKQALASMLTSTFAPWIMPESPVLNRTLLELVSRQQRVVITVDDAEVQQFGGAAAGQKLLWWGPKAIWNTYANNSTLTVMQTYDSARVLEFNTDGQQQPAGPGGLPFPPQCARYTPLGSASCLYKISWTLTTDADAIFRSLTPGNPNSLISMAGRANADLERWVGQGVVFGPPRRRMGHILIGDDFTNSPLFDVVLQQNLDMGKMQARQGGERQQEAIAEW